MQECSLFSQPVSFCPPSALSPLPSLSPWPSSGIPWTCVLCSHLSSSLSRRTFPRDSAILIHLMIHLRTRATCNAVSCPGGLVWKFVLTHWLFSGRCALSFPALAALVSLASARGLAAVLRGAQAVGSPGVAWGWLEWWPQGAQWNTELLDCCWYCHQEGKGLLVLLCTL